MRRSIDLESFVRAAGDAIIAVGSDSKIILWNPSAERVFGFTATDAIGQSLDLIIPERFRERHWNGFRQVMLSGQTRYGAEVLHVPSLRNTKAWARSCNHTLQEIKLPSVPNLGCCSNWFRGGHGYAYGR